MQSFAVFINNMSEVTRFLILLGRIILQKNVRSVWHVRVSGKLETGNFRYRVPGMISVYVSTCAACDFDTRLSSVRAVTHITGVCWYVSSENE
jgi:hypothetical protein